MTRLAEWLKDSPCRRGDLAEIGALTTVAGRPRLTFPTRPITAGDRDIIGQLTGSRSVHSRRHPAWLRVLERIVRSEWCDGERRWNRE